jgi:hypothetical protein
MVVLGGPLGATKAEWEELFDPVVAYEPADSIEAQGPYGQIPTEPMILTEAYIPTEPTDSYIPTESTDSYIPTEPVIPPEPPAPLYYTQ